MLLTQTIKSFIQPTDGFSASSIVEMMVSLGKEKRKTMADQKNIAVNRERLNARLIKYGLKEKRVIPGTSTHAPLVGDGNCQFAM